MCGKETGKNYTLKSRILFDGYLIKGHIFAKRTLIISKLLFDAYLIESDEKKKYN